VYLSSIVNKEKLIKNRSQCPIDQRVISSG